MTKQVCNNKVFVARLVARGQTPWSPSLFSDKFVQIMNLPVSYRPSDPGAPYSFVATFGHYLYQLIESSIKWRSKKHTLLLLNPAFNWDSEHLHAALAKLKEPESYDLLSNDEENNVGLILDMQDRVIAYVVPASLDLLSNDKKEALKDLSCLDRNLDTELLECLGFKVSTYRVRLSKDHPKALLSLESYDAVHSVSVYTTQARIRALRTGSNKVWAVITQHAGDILIVLKVLEKNIGNISAIVVHSSYADIVRQVAPSLEVIEIDAPVQARGDISAWSHPLRDDLLYFERFVLPALDNDVAIQLLRPIRDYVSSDYTLAAQTAFMLGDESLSKQFPAAKHITEHPSSKPINLSNYGLNIKGKRVLLHFDGGWNLKVYPSLWQDELIQNLQNLGFKVSVLGAHNRYNASVDFCKFENLDSLHKLILDNDLLIGMDSFPCHYASLHLKVPTICLFASTRWQNIAHRSDGYVAISSYTVCAPDIKALACSLDGSEVCYNFPTPSYITKLLEKSIED